MPKRLVVFGIFLFATCAFPANGQASIDQPTPQQRVSPRHDGDDEVHGKPQGWQKLVAWPEGITAWAILFTLGAIIWQAKATADAAQATETIVLHSKETSKLELRAYLVASIGPAIYQERRTEEDGGDLRFECRPVLTNTGKTPARNIKFKARAAILPLPLPKETHLPEGTDEGMGGSLLGAQQSANMFSVVDGFCQDNEVHRIKEGCHDKALHVWGLVTYDDIFGETHHTRFCHHIYWTRKGDVRGFYVVGRNDAT